MNKITGMDKMDKTARTMSRTNQQSAHTAMDYALKAQEMNTRLLRRTSQAWIEGFRYQAKLSQGMAQVFFGQRGNAFASPARVELPVQEQSKSKVTEPATDGAQKVTEAAAKSAQNSTELAAEKTQKSTGAATFPIEGYDEMNVGEVSERLDGLSADELKRVGKYEKDNKDRGSLRKEMKQKIKTTS